MTKRIGDSIPRPDGKAKAGGAPVYIADFPHDALTARFYRSTVPRGTIRSVTLPKLPEGYHIVDHKAVPGNNHIALIKNDWPAFAVDEVRYVGQIMFVVAGPDPVVVDQLLDQIDVEYDEVTPAVTLDEALALKGGPIHGKDNLFCDLTLTKGDAKAAFERAARVVEGTYETGFQEQMYMEPQGLMVWPEDDGKTVVLHGSLQCPFYVKHAVEEVMGPDTHVRVIQSTTGGGFGGKEDYPEIMGGPLAAAAVAIGKPLRCIFDRTEDIAFTSKRHPSRTVVRTAHEADGTIIGFDFDVTLDGGAYESYTLIVLQRAIFTSNGVYDFPNAHVHGRGVATNTVPSGAFRGFGAPQAIFALESHMEKVAAEFNIDPMELREKYFVKQGGPTITGGHIREEVIMDQLTDRAKEKSCWAEKRAHYAAHPELRRGIGVSMFAHGCGFTGDGEQRIIKGKVKLRKDKNDRVEILMANIDMGQGPKTTFPKIVGSILGIDPMEIILENPDTDRVPDSGPTVASRTIMVVGYLVQEAAKKLKAEWKAGEAQEVETNYAMPPGMAWDQENLQGDAYPVYGWGVNIVEVEVDPVSFEPEVLGIWAEYDVGVPIDDKVVIGQIHGGMSQGLGYGSFEKCEVDDRGVFKQATMADYIIATSLDFPRMDAGTIDNPYEFGPFGAKGMGEITHDGGAAAYAAAVAQAIGRACDVIPLTPERVMDISREERQGGDR